MTEKKIPNKDRGEMAMSLINAISFIIPFVLFKFYYIDYLDRFNEACEYYQCMDIWLFPYCLGIQYVLMIVCFIFVVISDMKGNRKRAIIFTAIAFAISFIPNTLYFLVLVLETSG